MLSSTRSPYSAESDMKLMTELWDPEVADNLYNFVMTVFPWGKPNTPLEKFKEPRTWQIDELLAMTDHITSQKTRIAIGEEPEVYQSAIGSGRGIGKSALTSWLNLWMLTTRPGSTAINSANTETQLKSKTWAEVGKWHTLAINSHWFDKMALSLKPTPWFEEALKTQWKIDTGYYYAAAQLWSEDSPESFAGAHNQSGILLIFDEASGIPKPIWTVSEGFFTEPVLDRYWFVFSNCRRNTGQFFECFHHFRDYWRHKNIDSRTVEGTDKRRLNQIVSKYGEDSDEARIEVKGQFPRQGETQFISREAVQDAIERPLDEENHAPLILGVDPARFGDASTILRWRQGRDARSIPAIKIKGMDNMMVANKIADEIDEKDPDAVCIDAGNGTGIIDRLRERGYIIHEVWYGSKTDDEQWKDKRTELWAKMRDWLGGGCIDADDDLKTDLVTPQYQFVGAGADKIKLESKESMKKRGFASPDNGDALANTFFVNIARRDGKTSRRGASKRRRSAKGVDYAVI